MNIFFLSLKQDSDKTWSMRVPKRMFSFFAGLILAFGVAAAASYDGEYGYDTYQNSGDYKSSYEDDSNQDYYDYSSYDPSINDNSGSGPSSSLKPFFPTQSYYELLGPMKAKNGTGHVHVTNWMTKLGLINNRGNRFMFNLDTAFRLTWIHGKENADLDMDRLYTVWLSATAGYRLFGSTYLMAGVTPEVSSDLDTWCSHDVYWGGHALLRSKLSNTLDCSVGLAYAPQLGNNPLIPFFIVNWKMSPVWTLHFEGTRLALMNREGGRFSWGPFCSIVSGTWTVNHNRRHERFEWISCVLGIATETKLGTWGSVRPKLVADVGISVYNSARFKTVDGKDELSKQRMDSGFYIKVGLQFAY